MAVAELGSGGAEAVVADLASDLLLRGHDVTVASNGGWRGVDLAAAGALLLDVPLRGRRSMKMLRAAGQMRLRASREPWDLVHTHNVRATLVAHVGVRWPARRPPILATVHGLDPTEYRLAVRLLASCADVVVAVSQHAADSLARAGFPADRLQVIENAAAAPASHDRRDARERLGLAADVPVAVCAARMAAPKRHDLLVEAWRQVTGDAVLLIAGDGPLRSNVESAIRAAGLEQRVRLLGDRQDLDWLLAAADLVVLPSDREGLPMIVLEAMAAGVPVVASSVGGVAGLDRRALELVDPRRADAMAAGLAHVLFHPEYRAALATNGLMLVNDRFSPARMRASYAELYDDLVQARRAGSKRGNAGVALYGKRSVVPRWDLGWRSSGSDVGSGGPAEREGDANDSRGG
jgi:glycosyltransferase involved in cell wall biosynthesis